MKPLSILVVDDNMNFLQSVVGYLNTYPAFTLISWATMLEDVFHKLELYKPDLVLLDLTFRELNGFDLTKKIKANFPDTHLIILSFYDNIEYRNEAFSAGADFLIEKTKIIDNLIPVLNNIFSETL